MCWRCLLVEDAEEQCQKGCAYAYRDGHGVPQDYAEAARCFRKAAERGNALAQKSLGGCFANGRGVPQDDEQAVHWHRMAAEQNDVEVQTSLGVCYQNGSGVPQDFVVTYKFYKLAAEQDWEIAVGHLNSIAARVATVEIAKAERRHSEFKNAPPKAKLE